MNEDDIKKLRHSFTNPYREDLPQPKKNQFGHTILGGNETEVDTSEIEVKIDELGQVRADMRHSLVDSPKVSEWAKKQGLNGTSEIEVETEEEQVIHKPNIYASLLSELDEMDGSKKQEKPPLVIYNRKCVNKDCCSELPSEAKFCMNCGTAQLSLFCTECGFKFPGVEKFCPDCGTKR